MDQASRDARIIAIDTSSRIGSVAVGRGPNILASSDFSADMNHAAELLPAIDRLVAGQGWPGGRPDHFYVSAGPGSFTGLRIGITVARTLAASVGTRLVAVPTVDVLSVNALELSDPPANLAVVLDAKRRQVYAAVFRLAGDTYEKTVDAAVMTPAELLGQTRRPLALLGEGLDYHRDALTGPDVQILPSNLWQPHARTVYRLGWRLARQNRFADPRKLIPIYLRRPEAEEVWEARNRGRS
jgi:tRNA threonylcarbamoyladenosine biosynthesis protein TsaB